MDTSRSIAYPIAPVGPRNGPSSVTLFHKNLPSGIYQSLHITRPYYFLFCTRLCLTLVIPLRHIIYPHLSLRESPLAALQDDVVYSIRQVANDIP